MKFLKLNILLYSFFIANSITAQNATGIIGKWHNEDEGAITKCYFFEHKGSLYGLVYYYQEGGEKFSLEKELKAYEVENIEDLSSADIFQYLSEYVWFKDFKKDGNEWSGKFIYTEKGETSDYESALKLINKEELKVSFKYWGIEDSGIWRRDNI
ncbi:MAG: hypothetical protein AAFZ15_23975 [Bacteroidota bacterium]